MLTGVSLPFSDLPSNLIARHQFGRLVHNRDGEREARFLFAAAERLLPVQHDGQLLVARWGNRRGESRKLPLSGWTWRTSVDGRVWSERERRRLRSALAAKRLRFPPTCPLRLIHEQVAGEGHSLVFAQVEGENGASNGMVIEVSMPRSC